MHTKKIMCVRPLSISRYFIRKESYPNGNPRKSANEIVGWTKHGNHRFGGAIGTQRSWKRIQPKKDEEGFLKVDENMEIPFN